MRWAKQQEDFIRKNIHLTNSELAEKLGTTLASVENKVRQLGLARTFQKHEIEKLKKVWGKKRAVIERALPRFTWRQISKKARNIGLLSHVDMCESVHLYSIARAMGHGSTVVNKWLDNGLRVTSDKGKDFKNNILYVEIDDFWDFAIKNPDIVDVCRLPDDILGVPPDEIVEMRKTAKPFKKPRKPLSIKKQKELAHLFYESNVSTERCAAIFGVSVATVRHVAAKHKKKGQKRDVSRVVTPEFLTKLEKLFYVEMKTRTECATELKCSVSSVERGLHRIVHKNKV